MNDEVAGGLGTESIALTPSKTAYPFLLAVDSRTFGLPLLDLIEEVCYVVDSFQLHVPLPYGEPVLPSAEEVGKACPLLKDRSLTAIVHFAPDPRLGDSDATERSAAQKALITSVERLKPLKPHAYVLELTIPDPFVRGTPRSIRDAVGDEELALWKGRVVDSIRTASEACRVPMPCFCIETSTYPVAEIVDMIHREVLSYCIDVGTLFRFQYHITEHIVAYMSRTKVFHLHGISPAGEPHQSLEHFPHDHIVGFLGMLSASHYSGSVVIEVRDRERLAESLRRCDRAYRELRGLEI
jgi:hypothetical protein